MGLVNCSSQAEDGGLTTAGSSTESGDGDTGDGDGDGDPGDGDGDGDTGDGDGDGDTGDGDGDGDTGDGDGDGDTGDGDGDGDADAEWEDFLAACLGYADFLEGCFMPGYTSDELLMVCEYYYETFMPYGAACFDAYDTFLVCLNQLTCDEFQMPNECDDEAAEVASNCGF